MSGENAGIVDAVEAIELRDFAQAELTTVLAELSDDARKLLPRYSSLPDQIKWARTARSLGLTKKSAENPQAEESPWAEMYQTTPK